MALLDEGMPANQRLEEAKKDLTYLLDRVEKSHAFGLLTLGWVRYYQGDAVDAIARWNNALSGLAGLSGGSAVEQAQIEAMRTWLKESIQKVYKWQSTRIWKDLFDRPDSATVGNGWMEDEKVFKVSLKGGMVQFGPAQAVNGEKPTLWREWDAAKVLKASFAVEMDPSVNAFLEIAFRIPVGKQDTTAFALIRRDNGTAYLKVKKDQKTKEAEEAVELPGFTWPADGKVSFGFVKMNEEKGIVTLLLNGKPVAGAENMEVLNMMKSRGGKIRMEVRLYAGGGTDMGCRVEGAEVWLDVQ
jgi:hypothetical protein